MKRVIGIGNALTDMLVNLKSDSVLSRFKLAKGSMSLVDTTPADRNFEIRGRTALLAVTRRLGGQHHPRHGQTGLRCRVHRQGRTGYDGRLLRAGARKLGCGTGHLPGHGAFGQMRVAHLARRRTHDGHPSGCRARTDGRRDRSVDFSTITTVSTSRAIWCRTTT